MLIPAAMQWARIIEARQELEAELSGRRLVYRKQLGRLYMGGLRKSLRDDYPLLSPRFVGRLERRARRAAMIAEHAEGGLVGVIYGGRDCDGFEAYHGDVLPASVIALEYLLDIADHNEGFFRWELCSPREAREHGYQILRGGWNE